MSEDWQTELRERGDSERGGDGNVTLERVCRACVSMPVVRQTSSDARKTTPQTIMNKGEGKTDCGGTRSVVIWNENDNVIYGFKFYDRRDQLPEGFTVSMTRMEWGEYAIYMNAMFPEKASTCALLELAKRGNVSGEEQDEALRAVEAEVTLTERHLKHIERVLEDYRNKNV
jgi:hypothetical protein